VYIKDTISPGMKVAIATGSHGGATAEGQRAVLEGYGITEDYVRAPIHSSMDVVQIGQITVPEEIPVYMDKNAYGADGVIVVNRLKIHTDFHGEHESGIVKMLTIGLGKHAQAIAVHRHGAHGLQNYIPMISQKVVESGKIIAGLAFLEDGYENTADIKFAHADEIFSLDAEF